MYEKIKELVRNSAISLSALEAKKGSTPIQPVITEKGNGDFAVILTEPKVRYQLFHILKDYQRKGKFRALDREAADLTVSLNRDLIEFNSLVDALA